jgi:DNA mismatch repair protein MutL
MARVHLLPPGLVNQIAAGEVVERPASIVKELAENSLDAGATQVTVDVEEGGLALVRVADDGCGMDRADAVLALERHATSKLADAAGLAAIATMGFRGEALPAIASVSRFRLDTAPGGDGEGTRIEVEGGAARAPVPIARARGTTIEVRDLFFNTPARRKFMRASATEASHVSEAIVRLALARPDVGFTLRSSGRLLFGARAGGDLADRVGQALGREAFRHLVEVGGRRGEVAVRGFVCAPAHSEATGRSLYLFVNGRYIRDRSAAHAVLRAYMGTLPAGRYPAGALFVDLPLDRVDVNVHPQKLEVRFAEPREVQDALHRLVAEALRTAPWLQPGGGAGSSLPVRGPGLPPVPPGGWTSEVREREEAGSVLSLARALHAPEGSGGSPLPPGAAPALPFTMPDAAGEGRPVGYFASLRYVGQHARTYLLCEGSGGRLVVIDQHASHERMLFHRLREEWRARAIAVQPYLVPQVVSLSAGAARAVEAHREEIGRLGLEVEPFGGESFAVKGAPAALAGLEVGPLLADLADQLGELERGTAVEDAFHHLLATMACHAAVRAHQDLAPEEARALLDGLDAVDFKGQCPHGRPVVLELELAELERRVGRR